MKSNLHNLFFMMKLYMVYIFLVHTLFYPCFAFSHTFISYHVSLTPTKKSLQHLQKVITILFNEITKILCSTLCTLYNSGGALAYSIP